MLSREELLRELERLQQRVTERDGADFIVELVRLRRFLDQDPRLKQILDELRGEAEQTEADFLEADGELVPRIVDVKSELVESAPDAADAEPRPRPEVPHLDHVWIYSFTNFDLVAADDDQGMRERRENDKTKTGFLLRVLEARLHELQWLEGERPAQGIAQENQRPELEPFTQCVARLSHEHWDLLRSFQRASGSQGGFALEALDEVLAQADPPAPEWETQEDEERYANAVFMRVMGRFHLIERALRPPGQRDLDAREQEQLQELVERLKPVEDQLFEAVRERVLQLPSPASTRPGLGRYFRDWLGSPLGAVLVVTPAGQAVIQLVTKEGKASGWLLLVAAVAAVLPPVVRALLAGLLKAAPRMEAPRTEWPDEDQIHRWEFRDYMEVNAIQVQRRLRYLALAFITAVLVVTLVINTTLGVLILDAVLLLALALYHWRGERA